MNPIRKLVRLIGLDLHRYYPTPEKLVWLKQFKIKTVIDVGANVGQFAAEVRQLLPLAKIYSFEPIASCYQELVSNFKSDNNFQAYNFALGDKNETSTINKSTYTLSSSLLPMAERHQAAFPHTRDSRPEQITVKRLDDALANEKLNKNLLIKIDTQGYEDKVIAGGEKILSQARVLIVETSFVELYGGQELFADIYSRLTRLGFTYHGALHQKLDQTTGEILFEDSWFISSRTM